MARCLFLFCSFINKCESPISPPMSRLIFIYSYRFCQAHMLVLWMINAFVIWRAVLVSWVSPFKWKTGFHLWWTYEGSWQVLVQGTRPAEQKRSETKHELVGATPLSAVTPLKTISMFTFSFFLLLFLSLMSLLLQCVKVLCFWLYLRVCIFVASDVNMNNSFSSPNMMCSRWAGRHFIKFLMMHI